MEKSYILIFTRGEDEDLISLLRMDEQKDLTLINSLGYNISISDPEIKRYIIAEIIKEVQFENPDPLILDLGEKSFP